MKDNLTTKQENELIEKEFLINKVFNNDEGRLAIKVLQSIQYKGINFTNANYLYYKEGQQSIIDFINKIINKED
jgi:hypothetical protein